MKILTKWILFVLCVVPFAAQASDVPSPLKLIFEDQIITLNFRVHPQVLVTETVPVLALGGLKVPVSADVEAVKGLEMFSFGQKEHYRVDLTALEAFVSRNVAVSDFSDSPVRITQSVSGKAVVQGFPKSGFSVDFETLALLINQALLTGHTHVRVPAEKTFSPVIADEELKARGIESVLSIGHSNFEGSSDSRRINIAVAAEKYNGLILSPGEQFSFNDILGSVDPADGFVEELVIKGDDTEKEFGGGVCQVSSTIYRAAFEGGLLIDQRRNHSYAVPYYQPAGLDATIYLGGQDFKFTNDTPKDLLVQAVINRDDIYFVFYGTHDGRRVHTQGPFVSNHRPAPEPIIEETTILPPGEEAYLSEAHDGFDATWVRNIYYANGKAPEKQTFNSYYRAWPAKVLKGTEDPLAYLEYSTFAPSID